MQREAAVSFEGSTMVLAGAGTGKTRVITSRIAYMLDCGVKPYNIAAMTFTNKAAKEMRERLKVLVGSERTKKLSISTFHSFCLAIIRNNPKAIKIMPGFTLLGTSDQLDLVRKALDEKGWSGLYKPDEILYQISVCKNQILTPNDLRKLPNPTSVINDTAVLAELYEIYERQLVLNRAIDFDDCIFKVVKTLQDDVGFRNKLREKYKYILVDEFQDTNLSQFSILEMLGSEGGNICVVGDDDQSIYSWRGAMYETLQKFESIFKPKIIKLEQNYRCTNVILHAANTLIKNNSIRMDKTLWSTSDSAMPIDVIPQEDAAEEARWLAQRCISLLGAGRNPYEIAILYRANSQAKIIEMALRETSLPYKTFGGQSFFERKEIKDFMAYLRLIGNKQDSMALWRVINTPNRGIGLKTQEKIESIALRSKKSPFEVMSQPDKLVGLNEREINAICSFIDPIEELSARKIEQPTDFEALGDDILSKFRLYDYVKKTTKNVNAKQAKLEAMKSLPKWLRRSAEDMIVDLGVIDSTQLIDRLTLNDTPYESDNGETPNFISLMTIHSSKGLEFPVVFVVGVEDGLLPHKNSIGSSFGISEERRLLYVAMTRAKEKLFLSYAHLRQSGYQKEHRKPSRFLEELPKDNVNAPKATDYLSIQQEEAHKRKKSTISKLSSLRKGLRSGNL